MPSLCLLHNSHDCWKTKRIERSRNDDRVRIVHAYDWNTTSDNTALIQKEVDDVINKLKQEFSVKFSFKPLGAKDGSIYCDICRQIRAADIAIFDISTYNHNVIFELGLAIGSGSYVFILKSQHYQRQQRILSDLSGILEYRFSRRSGKVKFATDFKRSLKNKLRLAAKRRRKVAII